VDGSIDRYKTKRIAVLMGGMSGEREISLLSGARVLESLLAQGFNAIGIDADRRIAEKLASERVDCAFIMLHGRFGEDGSIQGLLEQLGIPYTGSGVLASALSMDKVFSKKLFSAAGIPTPEYVALPPHCGVEHAVGMVLERLDFPIVIKPVHEGSSLGVIIVEGDWALRKAITADIERFGTIFAERFIKGTCVTVGILGLGEGTRALSILELRPKGLFYDYEAKYTPGRTEFVCPARLASPVYQLTQKHALMAHHSLGCRGFSRVDLQIDESGIPYVLEVNTIPGMTKLSDLPAEAESDGMSYNDLVVEILKSALI